MKLVKLGLAALAFGVCAAAYGQLPVISSFSQNGLLVCSNLSAGSLASVEWASSATGTWQTNWDTLDAVVVNTNGMIQVSVPMFYRVRGMAQATNTLPTTNGTALLIPAGTFTMGNSIGDGDITDASSTNVYVSAFYMDTNLVSYSQWQTIYNWATSHGYGFANAGSGKKTNNPVQTVDWYDCVKWCNARSQQAGLTPVYYTDAGLTHVYTNLEAEVTLYVNWTTNGYRLPTEAEWEKAARGGLSGKRFPLGDTISETQANYLGDTNDFSSYDLGPNGYNSIGSIGGTSPAATSPVGSFAPNGYGLYDMAGNVMEWCWDLYGTSYGQPTVSNPTGPASGSDRVWRGGYWAGTAYSARCACRAYNVPTRAYYYYGFRCVRGAF